MLLHAMKQVSHADLDQEVPGDSVSSRSTFQSLMAEAVNEHF